MPILTAIVDEFDAITATCTQIVPDSSSSISQATDVDITNLQDGSVLVYEYATSKWVSTINLDKQISDGGNF